MTARPERGHVVCFGEVLLRLSPSAGTALSSADSLHLATGGAEANVAVALASLGVSARMVSALPDNPLGRRAIRQFRAAGVDCSGIVKGDGRIGLYFFEPPSGPIAGRVTYDRTGSVFSGSSPDDFNFEIALEGASLLHLSGITPALGPGGVELARAAVAAARCADVPVCFDGNYRANLWDAWDCDPRSILRDLVSEATILIGNHRDISLLLNKTFSGDGLDRRREAAEACFAAFQNLEVIASTARHVQSATNHRLAGRVDLRQSHWQTDDVTIAPIVDRIGTGDAYAAGVLLRWLESASAQEMAKSGLALAVMKHGVPGDMIAVTPAELEQFDPAGADVRR